MKIKGLWLLNFAAYVFRPLREKRVKIKRKKIGSKTIQIIILYNNLTLPNLTFPGYPKTNMKITFLLLFIVFFCSSSQAQSNAQKPVIKDNPTKDTEDSSRIIGHVYHVNFWGSLAIGVGGQAALLIAHTSAIKPLITDQEFDAAQSPSSIASINGFDRWALNIGQPSRDYTYIAVGLQTALTALPLTLLFGERYRKNWDDIVLLLLEVNTFASDLFQFSPFGAYFQNRFRPVVYYAKDEATRNHERDGGNRNSLFSGHTTSAAASMFFMAKVYCDYNPQIEGWEKVGIYSLASIPVLAMGYLRLIALRHFPSDIVVGGFVGGLCGILVPEMHRIENKNVSLGVYTSPASSGLNFAWNLK